MGYTDVFFPPGFNIFIPNNVLCCACLIQKVQGHVSCPATCKTVSQLEEKIKSHY